MLPPDGMNLGPYLGPPAAVKARIVDPQPEVLPGPIRSIMSALVIEGHRVNTTDLRLFGPQRCLDLRFLCVACGGLPVATW
jgi:hypothetical protein